MGELDDDGFLYLRDRKIDMIISGGVNIYPAEVEAALLSHPAVGDAAVFGIPNDEWGEEVKAVVEPAAGPRGRAGAGRRARRPLPIAAGPLQVPAQHRLHRRHAPRPQRQALQATPPRPLLGGPRAHLVRLASDRPSEPRSTWPASPSRKGSSGSPTTPTSCRACWAAGARRAARSFFPRRLVCAQCLHEGTDDVELSTRGRIHTWTYCHVPHVRQEGRRRLGLRRGPGRPARRAAGAVDPARRARRLRHRHGGRDRPRDAAHRPVGRRGRDLPVPAGRGTATRAAGRHEPRPALRRRGRRRHRHGALRDAAGPARRPPGPRRRACSRCTTPA